MAEFEADQHVALADLTMARADLISAVQSLTSFDLQRVRRGGWPVARVIEHSIEHDYMMAMAASAIRGQPVAPRGEMSCDGQPVDEIICRMESGRTALLTAVKDVTEEQFYRLLKLGHEEFSVLSVLENAASHDREHAGQIRSILASA